MRLYLHLYKLGILFLLLRFKYVLSEADPGPVPFIANSFFDDTDDLIGTSSTTEIPSTTEEDETASISSSTIIPSDAENLAQDDESSDYFNTFFTRLFNSQFTSTEKSQNQEATRSTTEGTFSRESVTELEKLKITTTTEKVETKTTPKSLPTPVVAVPEPTSSSLDQLQSFNLDPADQVDWIEEIQRNDRSASTHRSKSKGRGMSESDATENPENAEVDQSLVTTGGMEEDPSFTGTAEGDPQEVTEPADEINIKNTIDPRWDGPGLIELNNISLSNARDDFNYDFMEVDDEPLQPTHEISHTIARKLCEKLAEKHKNSSGRTGKSYLWAPIYQYAGILERGFPLAPPEFTPGCMKWSETPCNGTEVFPLMRPCTFWAPMPISSAECFRPVDNRIDDGKLMNFVNYRPEGYNESYCPCRWPCTPQFDRVQYCRVNLTSTDASNPNPTFPNIADDNSNIPFIIWNYKALQICRGMKDFLDKDEPIKVDSIPIRIRSLSKEPERTDECLSWKYTPCKRERWISKPDDGSESTTMPSVDEGESSSSAPGENESSPTESAPSERRKREYLKKGRSAVNVSFSEMGPQFEACDTWMEIQDPNCIPEEVVERAKTPTPVGRGISKGTTGCKGHWPCYLPLNKNSISTDIEQKRRKRELFKKRHNKMWVQVGRSIDKDDSINGSVVSRKVKHRDLIFDIENEVEAGDDNSDLKKYAVPGSSFMKGPGCNCLWPCLPFFDPVNKCYNEEGRILVDANGKPIIPYRKFSRMQKQLVLCLSYLEKNDINCFIKD